MSARNVGANVLLVGVSWLVPAVVAVVAVPITVRGLGDDGYGVLVLVAAVTGYLGLMDLGLGNGIVRYLSMFVVLRYGRATRECLRVGLAWFTGGGVVGAIAVSVSAPWLVSLLHVPPGLVPQAVVAFRLGGVAFGLGMVVTVFQFVPQAFLRYGVASALNVTLGSLSLAGPAILVTLGYGLVPVMWFGVAVNGVACVAWIVVGVRLVVHLPNEGPGFRGYWREFLGFSAANATNRIWTVIQTQTSRTVVGIAGGTAQAAYFQVPTVLSDKVSTLLGTMSSVLLPTGSQMAADGNHDLVVDLYERSSRLFYLLNASVTGSVVVFSAPLLAHWVGLRYAQQGGIALSLLTLAAGVNATTMSASQVNLALGRPRVNLAFALIYGVIGLGTVYSLTVALGITGTALSGLLAAAIAPVFLHYTHRRVFAVSSWRVFRDCYLHTSLAVAGVATLSWLVLRPLASNLVTTLALVCVSTAAGLAASAATGVVNRSDWASLRSALRGGRSDPVGDGPDE
jgi:O-antigen/teichoic acid export membrane protein